MKVTTLQSYSWLWKFIALPQNQQNPINSNSYLESLKFDNRLPRSVLNFIDLNVRKPYFRCWIIYLES